MTDETMDCVVGGEAAGVGGAGYLFSLPSYSKALELLVTIPSLLQL